MKQRSIWPLVIAVSVAVLASLAGVFGLVRPIQRVAGDAMVRASVGSPLALAVGVPDVALVTIDPRSLRAIGEWPWPRARYAEAIERLEAAGARAIAFDIDFSTPRDSVDDAGLVDAVAASGHVALASFRQVQRLAGGGELEIANVPYPKLAEAASNIGSVIMPVDADGVVRRSWRVSSIGGVARPTLAHAALAIAEGGASDVGPERLGESMLVDYRRSEPRIPEISMIDILDGNFDSRDVAGRVVFIGATAAEFQDLWATPLGPARPGVWIQTVLYRTLAAESVGASILRTPSHTASALGFCLLSLLAAAANLSGNRRRIVGLIGLAALTSFVEGLALLRYGWLIDPVLPLAVLGAHYALGLEVVRRRVEGRLVAHQHSLVALERVGEATVASREADPLTVALSLLGDVVDARGVVLLRSDANGQLDGERLEWHRNQGGATADLPTAQRALNSGQTRFFEGNAPGSRPGVTAVYSPLAAGKTPIGVLVVERDGRDPLGPTQRRTIATVGAQLALTVDNIRLVDQLRNTFETSIEAMASAIEARDGYTESHCRRLAVFSTMMADQIGLDADEIEAIRLGALLHDIGKIGIRDEILLKPGRFSAHEQAEMEKHATIGHGIIGTINGLHCTTLGCVRHHHERWDGMGYPDRLMGEEIPMGARIVAVVDVWDALSTARPYKPAYEQGRVRDILLKSRGTHFEPSLVDLFLDIFDNEGEDMLALIGSDSTVENTAVRSDDTFGDDR